MTYLIDRIRMWMCKHECKHEWKPAWERFDDYTTIVRLKCTKCFKYKEELK